MYKYFASARFCPRQRRDKGVSASDDERGMLGNCECSVKAQRRIRGTAGPNQIHTLFTSRVRLWNDKL